MATVHGVRWSTRLAELLALYADGEGRCRRDILRRTFAAEWPAPENQTKKESVKARELSDVEQRRRVTGRRSANARAGINRDWGTGTRIDRRGSGSVGVTSTRHLADKIVEFEKAGIVQREGGEVVRVVDWVRLNRVVGGESPWDVCHG